MTKFNPLDYPVSFEFPTRVASTHWMQHVPFAMALIAMVRPRIFVELGTYKGVSYCAFCQAIAHLRLDTRAYAVDTWRGDPHNGANDPIILEELRAFHDPLYAGFSRLVQATFDNALREFGDGTIDLMHIDGYHIYNAVSHDFRCWLPKMSKRGVVAFHDINVRERDFGVWKLWHEIKDRYPSFDLLHQHGLGVVAVGAEVPDRLRALLDARGDERWTIREYFHHLGQRITASCDREALANVVRQTHDQRQEQEMAYRSRLAEMEQLVRVREAELKEKTGWMQQLQRYADSLRARVQEQDARIIAMEKHNQAEVGELRARQQTLSHTLAYMRASLAWRAAEWLSGLAFRLAPAGSLRRRILGKLRRMGGAVQRRAANLLSRRHVGYATVHDSAAN
jgi:hypothetical protein